MERPRMLFVGRFPPWPARSGAPLRMLGLLRGLVERFEVVLITYEGGRGPEGRVEAGAVRAALPGVDVRLLPDPPGDKRRAQARSLAGRASFGYGRYDTPALRAALAEAARGVSLVHFDDPGTAMAGPLPGLVNVVAPHDLESRITRAAGRGGGRARQAYATLEAAKQAREEHALWPAMDLCVAVSEVDGAELRRHGARRVFICPNGTDPVDRLPATERSPGEPLRILFVGNGAFHPNAQGVAWFVREVLPRLREALPAEVDVVGNPPADPVDAPGVVYHGRVESLRDHYDRAHVAIAPIPFGSGTRLKIVEAMAYGRPVVSTTPGAEGLPVADGTEVLLADDPAAFAAALSRTAAALEAGDPWLPAMLDAARATVETLFWPRLATSLGETYMEAIAGRSAG